jgi:amino acid adenylation domain-containing protein/non-ribosomal peptide synthase protein (TIGR01720 family)
MKTALEVPPDLYHRILEVCRGVKMGVYIFVVSSLVAVLHRYTGDQDIIVGSPAFKTQASDDADSILLIRCGVAGDWTARQLLDNVREVVLEAYNYQGYSSQALFDKLFGITNRSPLEVFGIAVVDEEIQHNIEALNQFEIIVSLLKADDTIKLSFDYSPHSYPAWAIESFGKHLLNYMSRVIGHGSTKISAVDILSARERYRLVHEFNRTDEPYSEGLTVCQLFEAQAQKTPERLAVVCRESALTYRQLNEKTDQLARRLKAKGVSADSIVGILMQHSVEMIIAVFGVLKAGGAFLPLDVRDPHERRLHILRDSSVALLLSDKSDLSLKDFEGEILNVVSELHQLDDAPPSSSWPHPHDLAYVIYSSGSTGRPKGILIEHDSLTDFAQWAVKEYGHAEGFKTLFANLFAFDASVLQIIPSLISGGTLYVADPQLRLDIPSYMAYIRDHSINCIDELPRLLENFFHYIDSRADEELFPDLTALSLGSEPVPIELVRKCRKYFNRRGKIINGYGPSETTPLITTYAFNGFADDEISLIGKPRQNSKLFILDKYDDLCPIGVAGELCVSGKGLARGYLNNEELTQEKFVLNPFLPGERMFRTGDLARWLPDGNIEYLGRLDHQVKIRGCRVELSEVERILQQHPAVKDAAVSSRQGEKLGTHLIAYLTSKHDFPLDSDDLRRFLTERVPGYMIPSRFVWLPELPLTSNGKLDRQALFDLGSQSQVSRGRLMPETESEEILAGVWAEVLGVERVGVEENFFELGGDSILSIQIMARARQAGIAVTAKQMFEQQTVRELAAVARACAIDNHPSEPMVRAATPAAAHSTVPLTPIQHWFFAQDWLSPQHFNQAVLLKMPAEFDTSLLRPVLTSLEEHHAALRLRFVCEGGTWRQSIAAHEPESTPYSFLDLSTLPVVDQSRAIEEAADELQRSLNLERGPLWRAAYFNLGRGRSGRLLLIVHHLAIDGVSWRILLEELERCYEQAAAGEALSLRAEISSYEQWATALVEYAATADLREARQYWLEEMAEGEHLRLPVDEIAEAGGANLVGTVLTARGRLSREKTQSLLSRVPQVYGTQITEALVAALVGVLAQWTGPGWLVVDSEGHGREEVVRGVDVTQTVGWFTTLYPVRLEVLTGSDSIMTIANRAARSQPAEVAESRSETCEEVAELKEETVVATLKRVKEQMRRVPQRGLSYGVLRYLSGTEEEVERLRRVEQEVELSFNYLGQFDQVVGTLVHEAEESSGAEQDEREQRRYLMEVSALVLGGELRVSWSYSEQVHRRERVEQLVAAYLKWLEKLVEHCERAGVGGYTPSDFPLVSLSQQQLDKITAKFSRTKK